MKRILLISFATLTLVFIFGSLPQAFAQDGQRTLKMIMKDMAPLFQKLSRQISDASKNQDSIRMFKELNALTKESAGSRPDKIGELPSEKQGPAEVKYQQMLAELDMLTIEGESALLSGNQAEAKETLKKLGQLRNLGHDEFK